MFTAGLSGPLDPVVSLGAANVVSVDDAGPDDQQQHNSEEESSDEEMVRALFKHFVSFFVSVLAYHQCCFACKMLIKVWPADLHVRLNGSLE